MIKSTAKAFRDFVDTRLMLRGHAVKASDCGVPRAVLVAALRRTELLCNMPDTLADVLLETMAGRQVREGAVLYREGARGDSLILKASGVARVSQSRAGLRDTRVLATLADAAVLGQESFYGVEKRSVTVRMLAAGTVFHIRRAVFADLVANGFVNWVEQDAAAAEGVHLLWIGAARTRPRAMAGIPCMTIDRIKRYVREAPAGKTTCCCARDDTTAAFAAFLLLQCGLRAVAMRDGRKLNLPDDVGR